MTSMLKPWTHILPLWLHTGKEAHRFRIFSLLQILKRVMAYSTPRSLHTVHSEGINCTLVRGTVHHSTIHKEKSNKMQQCIKLLLFYIYMKLNMFRATHRPSSGAYNCTGSLWFFILGRLFGRVVGARCQAHCAIHCSIMLDFIYELEVVQVFCYFS
jgi:hypothetical protein